ncbi:4-hydroxy-3-methylbut-2-en-1-yl diphosphate synthase [Candidatus Micrarchaeota archaeon CG08_land_8_20_14_0_20_59_11]|nr:MAG: 4-hydroxy-3-methylbut-2-en-1-yl diphosphate synthase [Candidatus Micrarchaeota archaeon CG08_land_8_20_14_0_20_59_11]
MFPRRKSRQVSAGSAKIGGGAAVVVQSMCNTDTRDPKKTLEQIAQLAERGCELVRVAIPDEKAADAVKLIARDSPIPVCSDIHFDYKLALKCIDNGVSKLRINPGNIGGEEKVRAVVKVAKDAGIPMRIGVNAGSLEPTLLKKYGHPTPEAAVESAFGHIRILESLDFRDIVVSLKFNDVPRTVAAYRLMAKQCDYPLHLGVTEAGTTLGGSIKSSIALGALLMEGVGDTIRVSLTASPLEEVRVGYEILKDLGLRERGPVMTSCPTCGRTEINLIKIAGEVEERLQRYREPFHVAVMGCVVNGPGEAREADVGVAGGRGVGVIFRKGQVIRKVPEKEIVDALFAEIDAMLGERRGA